MIKLKYAIPCKLKSDTLAYAVEEGDKPDFTPGIKDIFSVYTTNDNIEWKDEYYIPKGRGGNLGPHRDMVYFGTGQHPDDVANTHTVAIPIELILLNPTAFKGHFDKYQLDVK